MKKKTLLFICWVILIVVAYIVLKQSYVEPTSSLDSDIPHMSPSIVGGWLP